MASPIAGRGPERRGAGGPYGSGVLVASVPVGGKAFFYSGVNGLIPIGHRARGIFTPPDAKVNVPVGAAYALGKWGPWGELDIGPQHAVGAGVTRLF